VYSVNRGVQIAIRPTWAFQKVPPEGGAFWRMRWVASSSLFSPIDRGRRAEGKCSTLLVSENHLKLVRKIVSVKKI